ncbi:MAG: M20/M25/M40 family metallo-hydrolase [Candidatus Aminicenantes bacterium]|nr:M20/M25/M40 family metallo-hydrolase [Candidatus Aminicenantes bacterium]NIM81803.1 M20/M25/M40 family metallo-hydrolase [Candidatus Aminicenantes bacterium]NIN21175.1 M20/M25/M40 family metallo-hydrolase [Candidatus Aminicenantes bacterium]NIN44999.1 M20/M25/M40 family metallo-hydrolase [Candidatus Aminicenantes bacterium]NIN87813.1 M20/M25/M40 family metallo-hydrolase [Candidatus Aminicenantes bacterium]
MKYKEKYFGNSSNKKMRFKRLISLVLFIGFIGFINLPSCLVSEEADKELIHHLTQTINAGEIFALIDELSSEPYQGRLTGTEGYNKAARFAADYFEKYGILTVFNDYMQSFPISYTKVYESTLKIYIEDREGKEEVIEGVYFKNYYPLNFSGSGDVKGEIVFAGYGMTAPEFGVDDYKGIDVKGKIVMVIKGVPKAKEGENWQKYDDHRFRTKNARDHGAAGFIYIYDDRANPNGNYLEGFPMVSITTELADKLLAANNLNTKQLKEALNARKNEGKNHSYATGITAHITINSENFQGMARNVVGYIPGSDPVLKDEYIVIGSHLDHCGMWPILTPGADDNASGSAAVLTAARALATYKQKPRRSVLFILFAGEEVRLLGSSYFVSHLPSQIKKIKFVINMDMVGAGPDMFILRLKNYPEFQQLMEKASILFDLKSVIKGNKVTKPRGTGADHAPFVVKGIPAVSVFSSSGDHHGYHTNTDTIYWITPKITEDIVRIVSYTAFLLADARP